MALKADLHLHTREGEAFIAYNARALIDRAAREGSRSCASRTTTCSPTATSWRNVTRGVVEGREKIVKA